jgi:membrane fusion protein, multidrug efflux system
MKLHIATLLAATIWLSACGPKQDTSLQGKKAELEKIKKEISVLQQQADKLTAEILKLDTTGGAKAKLISYTSISEAPFKGYVEVQGVVDAEQSTIATAQMPGVVTRVIAVTGMNVSKGQVLAEQDNALQRQQVDQAKQQLDFLTTLYEKQKKLWEKGIGTEIQYLTAKNQKEAMEKSLASAKEQLSMTQIKAQISGVIDEVNIKVGETAAPGLPLFKIVNLSGVKVTANVAETQVGKVRIGDAVNLFFPDLNTERAGKVSFVANTIDPVNRSFRCEARISDPGNLRPNMLAVVRITDYFNPKAVSVPLNIIQRQGENAVVYVAENKGGSSWTAKAVSVKTGRVHSGQVEILSGLKAGDKVITTGYQELSDGQSIQPTQP